MNKKTGRFTALSLIIVLCQMVKVIVVATLLMKSPDASPGVLIYAFAVADILSWMLVLTILIFINKTTSTLSIGINKVIDAMNDTMKAVIRKG